MVYIGPKTIFRNLSFYFCLNRPVLGLRQFLIIKCHLKIMIFKVLGRRKSNKREYQPN